MGMVDTGSYPISTYTIYDRVEYALSWMDRVITGQEFRNVLVSHLLLLTEIWTDRILLVLKP